jgi:hypothetical protein
MFRSYFLLPLLIPLVFVKGNFASGLFHPVRRWLDRLAARPARTVGFVCIVSFLACAGLTLCTGIPVPQTHDEFGYLLLADTFAHGRVTNPPPALWQHFETIHQIMQPSYTAKFPPGQGLALAAGECLGAPIIGVWLTTALACGALCWMLLAWMPARWALVGGLMTAFHPQVLEWSQNYWGGAVAMGGGALFLGACRRMVREPRARDAVWMGVGLGVMANSRPYEGFVLGLLVLLPLMTWFVMAGNIPRAILFRRALLPLAGVLLVVAAQIGFYNWRVTGNPLVMPYMVHEETYGIAPVFVFGTPRPEPQYRHPAIRSLQEDYLRYYQNQRSSFGALVRATGGKAWVLAQGYLWSCLMLVPLLALPWALARDRCLWFALFIGLFFLIAILISTWVFPHYAAVAAGLLFVLVVQSMRILQAWRIGTRPVGRNLVRGLVILMAISVVQISLKMAGEDRSRWFYQRQAILDKLSAEPGNSLVIVKYAPDHNPHREWIYNAANIETSKVILARDMGPQNSELLDYYRDRKVWVLDADAANPALKVYPGSSGS